MIEVTKYSSLTNEELLHEAYNSIPDGDELATELYNRLSDVLDELELWKVDYSDLDEETDRMRNEVSAIAEELKRKVAA